jgi:hypothetical protein
MEKHFVTFFSPGTFVAEETTKPIESWDIHKAVAMAKEVKERYNALPYGFQFSTRARGERDLDSTVIKTSGLYYLGGKIETVEDVAKRNDPKEKILLSNMKGNGWDKIVVNTNSWKWTQPLKADDTVLDLAAFG